MNRRETYRAFCSEAADLPVFFFDWYLDAVCEGGEWDFVSVEHAGKSVGIWPFFIKKKLFWRYSAMPKLARMLGPFLLKEHREADREQRLLKAFVQKLPADLLVFEQDAHYGLQNWLPFYWAGWRQTTRYSFKIDLSIGLDAVFQNMEADYRRRIRRSDEALSLRTDLPLEELHRVASMSFERQNLQPPTAFGFLEKLMKAGFENSSAQTFFAIDADGRTAAAAALVFDRQAARLLLMGDDPSLRASSASVWLIWQLLRFAHDELKVKEFDFLGSMIEPIEKSRRQFGARPAPYFRLQKERSVFWRSMKEIWR